MNYLDKYKGDIIINSFQKFNHQKLKKLFEIHKTADKIIDLTTNELIKCGVTEKTGLDFQLFKKDFNFDSIARIIKKENIGIITLNSKGYPTLLKEIYDPPHLLYYKGEIKNNSNINLAVVGSRKYSHYGEQVVQKIIGQIASHNITIVSGLALGIDALSHRAALNNNAKTIAILGTGLDNASLYPKSNIKLAQDIIRNNGLIMSEFPIGSPPTIYNFPKRNRVVSGLSLGVFVVEAEKKSGSLITAQVALDQNRELFTVPGNIFSSTQKGTNELIKNGAHIITSAEDVLDILDVPQKESQIKTRQMSLPTPEEQAILNHINHEPTHIDDLTRSSNLPAPTVSSTLVILEMKGIVKNIGNMEYILN